MYVCVCICVCMHAWVRVVGDVLVFLQVMLFQV